MRRWLAGIALGAVVTLVAVGCTRPAGIDGDVGDDWVPMAAPSAFTPESRTCHAHPEAIGYVRAYAPVDCDRPHRVETLHVGALPSADTPTPPGSDSAPMRTAFAECDRKVRTALGADWRTGRIGMSVVFPSQAAWTGGARWFRCDVTEERGLEVTSPVQRTASLAGALAGGSPLRHGCFDAKTSGDEVSGMVAVKCTARHRAEFVGVWKAPNSSYRAFLDNAERAHRSCRSLIAAFAKLPDDDDLQYRVGTIFYHPSEDGWHSGNRGVQCFLWSGERVLTRSMKGAGSRALPIN